jgi:hypothetical protein
VQFPVALVTHDPISQDSQLELSALQKRADNRFLDVVVRIAIHENEFEVPVGIVSKS